MGVGKQFVRIGERAAAYGLWGLVIYILSKPFRLFIILGFIFLLFLGIIVAFDNTGEIHYVNDNSIELFDKPFNKRVKKLYLNDSLVLLKKMSDDWVQVKYGNDTLYFVNSYVNDDQLKYIRKVERRPLSKWKVLEGSKVILNHPDGYLETNSHMLKNGVKVKVDSYSELKNSIRVRLEQGGTVDIPIEYVKINWSDVYKRYPRLKE
jgi:hypothetical protein